MPEIELNDAGRPSMRCQACGKLRRSLRRCTHGCTALLCGACYRKHMHQEPRP